MYNGQLVSQKRMCNAASPKGKMIQDLNLNIFVGNTKMYKLNYMTFDVRGIEAHYS